MTTTIEYNLGPVFIDIEAQGMSIVGVFVDGVDMSNGTAAEFVKALISKREVLRMSGRVRAVDVAFHDGVIATLQDEESA